MKLVIASVLKLILFARHIYLLSFITHFYSNRQLQLFLPSDQHDRPYCHVLILWIGRTGSLCPALPLVEEVPHHFPDGKNYIPFFPTTLGEKLEYLIIVFGLKSQKFKIFITIAKCRLLSEVKIFEAAT